jgi:hypothetical protein
MSWVTIRGARTRFPLACACCLQAPTTTLLAQKEKVTHLGVARIRRTFKTEVPYCDACKEHDFTDQSHTLVLHNTEFWRRCIEANADQVEAKG